MRRLYSFFIWFFERILPVLAWFSPKLKAFRENRNSVFTDFKQVFSEKDRVIWVHAASLGEYEQGVPLMEALKQHYPQHKILLSFFSPSGYTQKKNNPLAALTTYLPLDTAAHAKSFIDLVQPELAFFIKYEFWPNYLHFLKKKQVPTYLISGVFRENQIFFKTHGRWMLHALKAFDHFFVQDKLSLINAKKLGLDNVTVSGDTRFDRVSKQLEMDNSLSILDDFKSKTPLLVCGSTWPEDEALLIDFINTKAGKHLKVLLAPHQVVPEKIDKLTRQLHCNVGRFSERKNLNLASCDVFILDTIGLLGRAYSYAEVAYVGGAAGNTGLHNILEPATFGIPIVTGPNIAKFPEAGELCKLTGLFTVKNPEETTQILTNFFEDEKFRSQSGMIAGHFVQSQTGATQTIINYLKDHTLTA